MEPTNDFSNRNDDAEFLVLSNGLFCKVSLKDGRISALRGSWSATLGCPEADLLGVEFFSLVFPEDAEVYQAQLRAMSTDQQAAPFTMRLAAADGTYRLIEWSCRADRSQGVWYGFGRDVTEVHVKEERMRLRAELLDHVAKGAPIVISAYDVKGVFLAQIGAGVPKLGLTENQLVGVSVFDAFRGADDALAFIRGALEGKEATNTQDLGATIWDNWFSPIRDANGEIKGAVSISTDVTERERSRAALEERLRVIEDQHRAIRAMSTPIIEVWQGVLVVAVVGQLDADRATLMMERLLAAVVARGATAAILDLTAVEQIDDVTAEHLLRMVQALRLLGTQGMISGIRPSVAQALIDLGLDLGRVVTVATLHSALRICMEGGNKNGRLQNKQS